MAWLAELYRLRPGPNDFRREYVREHPLTHTCCPDRHSTVRPRLEMRLGTGVLIPVTDIQNHARHSPSSSGAARYGSICALEPHLHIPNQVLLIQGKLVRWDLRRFRLLSGTGPESSIGPSHGSCIIFAALNLRDGV